MRIYYPNYMKNSYDVTAKPPNRAVEKQAGIPELLSGTEIEAELGEPRRSPGRAVAAGLKTDLPWSRFQRHHSHSW